MSAMTASRAGTSFEDVWLPIFPLASDNLRDGIYRMKRERALGKRYVEANPSQYSNLLVVDIDHPDALLRALWDRKKWLPNAVVENPANGHAHAVWALENPFPRTEYARRKPLAYAAAITEGLRRSVDGDKGYSGLITKNPAHESWDSHWITDHLYLFDELAFHLEDAGFMPPKSWDRYRRKDAVGLGRNCTLFETVRTWAYPQINNHWGDPEGLADAIELAALQVNVDLFDEPLHSTEVGHVARSISKWITTKSRMWADGKEASDRRFSQRQAARARKQVAARQEVAADRLAEARNQLTLAMED